MTLMKFCDVRVVFLINYPYETKLHFLHLLFN